MQSLVFGSSWSPSRNGKIVVDGLVQCHISSPLFALAPGHPFAVYLGSTDFILVLLQKQSQRTLGSPEQGSGSFLLLDLLLLLCLFCFSEPNIH